MKKAYAVTVPLGIMGYFQSLTKKHLWAMCAVAQTDALAIE
jgi:hypothetical protein